MTWGRGITRAILLSVIAAGALAQAGFAQTISIEDLRKLETKLKAASAAFHGKDYQTLLNMTHPSAYQHATKEQMLEGLKSVDAQMEAANFKLIEEQYGVPGEIYEAGDELVCFYPRVMIMEANGKKYRHTSFMICLRKRTGGEWYLLDGGIVARDPSILPKLLPDLPADVQLPEGKLEPLEE